MIYQPLLKIRATEHSLHDRNKIANEKKINNYDIRIDWDICPYVHVYIYIPEYPIIFGNFRGGGAYARYAFPWIRAWPLSSYNFLSYTQVCFNYNLNGNSRFMDSIPVIIPRYCWWSRQSWNINLIYLDLSSGLIKDGSPPLYFTDEYTRASRGR